MENNVLFEIGQPVGIHKLTNLPLIKISQVEQTMIFDEKRFIVGRLLGIEETTYLNVEEQNNNLFIVTISGFVISAKKEDILLSPESKMDAFLKEQEYLFISQRLKPYNGRLVKINNNWCIQI